MLLVLEWLQIAHCVIFVITDLARRPRPWKDGKSFASFPTDQENTLWHGLYILSSLHLCHTTELSFVWYKGQSCLHLRLLQCIEYRAYSSNPFSRTSLDILEPNTLTFLMTSKMVLSSNA